MWGILLGIILVVTYTFILFVYCNKSYDNGYNKGYDQGYDQGIKDCIKKINEKLTDDEELRHLRIEATINGKEVE